MAGHNSGVAAPTTTRACNVQRLPTASVAPRTGLLASQVGAAARTALVAPVACLSRSGHELRLGCAPVWLPIPPWGHGAHCKYPRCVADSAYSVACGDQRKVLLLQVIQVQAGSRLEFLPLH
eukprot:TRINITY_DN11195_c0_g2_i1.p1 TRINITY_DN11195_c0_g2~~TRINITY_DN11195_c0_g2_i1.p1  ORF type:complete len:122 (-),score=0.83 TRINITY_DN11195_c0_g2_i1:79-444(-)